MYNRYGNYYDSCPKNKMKPEMEYEKEDKCACGFENDPSVFPENYMYGQSYVPIQYLDKIFKPEIGLKMGTIFPELVSPYCPGQSMAEDAYLRKKTGNEGKCPEKA